MPRQPSDARERIVLAAIELFAARGYHNTGIADILTESGCSRGVLYYNFSCKKELGFAVIDEVLHLLAEQGAGRHLRTNDHPIDKLLKMVDDLPGLVRLQSGEYLTPSLAARLGAVDAEFKERLSIGFRVLIDELEVILQRGAAEGQIADNVNPRVLAHAFVVMCEGILFAALLEYQEDVWANARRWLKEYLKSLRAQAGERTDRGRST
jgi:AcrR family transcriptional regulator